MTHRPPGSADSIQSPGSEDSTRGFTPTTLPGSGIVVFSPEGAGVEPRVESAEPGGVSRGRGLILSDTLRHWFAQPHLLWLAAALPALVIAIAVFMILNQLRIATEIVTITYAAVLGALALGMALAFGLGGRDVASRMLEDAYQRGREERARIMSERASAPATHAKTYAPYDAGGRPAGA